jgi:antitoxin ParD1/3/4
MLANMAQLNVSLPEALKDWANQRVAEGRYSSPSDYVRDLMRRDLEAEEARHRLQSAIDEGRASGISARGIEDVIGASRAEDRAA